MMIIDLKYQKWFQRSTKAYLRIENAFDACRLEIQSFKMQSSHADLTFYFFGSNLHVQIRVLNFLWAIFTCRLEF